MTDQQIISLAGANITAVGSTTTTGYENPGNIIDKDSGIDGADNTWLLEDDSSGSWTATSGFSFFPTKLRLSNIHQGERGTKTWSYTALPVNGIMNFTFIDPATQQTVSCTSDCPLSNNASIQFQDFVFVNNVSTDSFRIDIHTWYGVGGGLDGIKLFQDTNSPTFSGAMISSPTTISIGTSNPSLIIPTASTAVLNPSSIPTPTQVSCRHSSPNTKVIVGVLIPLLFLLGLSTGIIVQLYRSHWNKKSSRVRSLKHARLLGSDILEMKAYIPEEPGELPSNHGISELPDAVVLVEVKCSKESH